MSTTMTTAPADLQEFMDDLHERIRGHATRGETDRYLEVWSSNPDASIMAAVGGNHIGYDQVAALLHWVSGRRRFETYDATVLTVDVSGDLAFSVELEELTHGETGPKETLRTTHVYRREAGAWKLLHRHSEALTPVADL